MTLCRAPYHILWYSNKFYSNVKKMHFNACKTLGPLNGQKSCATKTKTRRRRKKRSQTYKT